VTNVNSLTLKACHVPLTALYRPVKALRDVHEITFSCGLFLRPDNDCLCEKSNWHTLPVENKSLGDEIVSPSLSRITIEMAKKQEFLWCNFGTIRLQYASDYESFMRWSADSLTEKLQGREGTAKE